MRDFDQVADKIAQMRLLLRYQKDRGGGPVELDVQEVEDILDILDGFVKCLDTVERPTG